MHSNNTKKQNENPVNNEPHFNPSTECNAQEEFSFRLALMLGESPVLFLPPQQVYRGDLRMPEGMPKGEGIFYKGFQALGSDPDLWFHLHAEGNSAYISTSLSKKIAEEFPKGLPENTHRSYVYEIHPTKPGIPVVETLREQGCPGEDDLFSFMREKERAFLSQIKSSEIKGCWEVDITKVMTVDPKKYAHTGYSKEWIEEMCYEYERITKKKFIPNPNYRPQGGPGQSLWLIGKPVGIGLTAFSFGLDAEHLYSEFKHGQETGNYDNAHREAAGVAGGWPTALIAGRWGVKLAATLCTSLSPWGRILFTAGFEIVASMIGYDAGNKEAKKIYDDIKENSVTYNQKLIADKVVNKSPTLSLFGNANAKEFPEETDPHSHQSTQSLAIEKTPIKCEESYRCQPKLNTYLQQQAPLVKSNKFFSPVNNHPTLDNPYTSNPPSNVHHQLDQDLEFMQKVADDLFQTHFNKQVNESETSKINKTTTKKPVIKSPKQFNEEAASLISGLNELHVANDKLILLVEEERLGSLDLKKMGDSLCKWGSAATMIADFAKQIGGHQRSWEGLEKAAEGLYRLGAAFLQFTAPNAGLPDMLAGGFGGALGILSIAKALFGNGVRRDYHMEALTQIMEAIQTLHCSMLEGFWRLEKLIHQNMMSVHYRLGRIQKQLDVLKGLVVVAAQELHQTNLINAISDIEKNMERQRYLRDETINDHLQCLQNWMEHHVFSCIQTDSLEKREDAEQHVSLLHKVSSVGNVFPVFVFQLQQ